MPWRRNPSITTGRSSRSPTCGFRLMHTVLIGSLSGSTRLTSTVVQPASQKAPAAASKSPARERRLTRSLMLAVPSASGRPTMGVLVVRTEQVGAEVVPRVVPHGVDVVRAVLAVVVLDEERGTVQPVVVRLLRVDGPGPREAHAL